MFRVALLFLSCLVLNSLPMRGIAQVKRDARSAAAPAEPVVRTYTIGGIRVEGVQNFDTEILLMLAGLKVGDAIDLPGEVLTKAVRSLWKQGLFGDVVIEIERYEASTVFLKVLLQERPRLSKFAFSKSLRKSYADDLTEKLKDFRGKVFSDHIKASSVELIKNYFAEKGYGDTRIEVKEEPDTTHQNMVLVRLYIQTGDRVRVGSLLVEGNQAVSSKKIYRKMKGTKPYQRFNIFRNAKYDERKYVEDKETLLKVYREEGFRDARIAQDTQWRDQSMVHIRIRVEEGNRYYFRNIRFSGNTLYPDSILSKVLGIEPGEVYSPKTLEGRLQIDPNGRDISSMYMDNGYLFFQVNPVEARVESDSVDLEIQIYEGAQATVNRVTVTGNTKTSEHVVLRELRTRPGQKFSRSDVIRTQRELSQLGYFDPEQLGVTPTPNPADGTVDIEYKVAERSNDQIELSGGWGAGQVVGTLGLVLNNFSARKLFDPSAWNPVPSGDGQRLSIRAQGNGRFFRSYNFSFTEPWLGGRKPNALSVSAYTTLQSTGLAANNPNAGSLTLNGLTLSLGKRLKVPDDYFTLLHSINFQQFVSRNYQITVFLPNGLSNNFFIRETLARNSIDQPIFPRSGSNLSLSVQLTPPYTALGRKVGADVAATERYRWMEYHKWRFDSQYFLKLAGNLVLMSRVQLGFLGNYSSSFGDIPLGRFYVGGDGLMGFQLDDRELIGLRGYQNNSLSPRNASGQFVGATAFQKYTMELRYPLTLNPSATIYVTSFLEAGNSFMRLRDFEPFTNFRSAGLGVRFFLPMFGLLGVDWGYGFDRVPGLEAHKSNFHITIGQNF